jgi:hypothetical protein
MLCITYFSWLGEIVRHSSDISIVIFSENFISKNPSNHLYFLSKKIFVFTDIPYKSNIIRLNVLGDLTVLTLGMNLIPKKKKISRIGQKPA